MPNEGVLDGLGHISVRYPGNPQRYLMSRSLAPALVKPSEPLPEPSKYIDQSYLNQALAEIGRK